MHRFPPPLLGRVEIPNGVKVSSGSAAPFLAPQLLPLLPAQDQTKTMHVERDHRQRHHTGKPIRAVGTHPVKTAMFKIVDRRFNRRMLASGLEECVLRLALTIGPRPTALAWQYVVIQQGIQLYPVLRTVKAAVKAAQAQVWILLLRPLDDRHCNIPIAAFPHDLVLQNETVIVLHHAHRYPQLHRTTRLTLRYPARVRLEYRKYLLRVGHHLALDQSPLHLIHLTTRMLDVVLYTRATSHQFWTRLARQLPQRLLGPLHQPLANTQIIFHTGRGRIRLTLPAYPVEGVFYTIPQMLPLTPAGHLVLLRCTGPVSRIRQRIESHSRLVSVG